MSDFVHLHVASAFSAHHGTTWPEALVIGAAGQGASAAALTDRAGLYGAVRHIRTCLAEGLAALVGADLRVTDSGTTAGTFVVTVLAHGRTAGAGWAGLARLISAAHRPAEGVRGGRRGRAGSANRVVVAAHRLPAFLLGGDGVPRATVLLGPGSDVGRAVLDGGYAEAAALLDRWRQRLPGGLAVEVVCHHTRPGTARSAWHAARLLELAAAAGVPAVLTNEVRYLSESDATTGDVLDAAGRLRALGSFAPQPNGQAWLKPAGMMQALAYQVAAQTDLGRSAAEAMLDATGRLAERCALDPVADIGWRRPKTPEPDLLGITGEPVVALRQQCWAALGDRYPAASGNARQRIGDRLRAELAIIEGFGFATYFLTVADVAELIRGMGVRSQARGSGAGSLVNYLLRISNIDPIEHDLLFERFLGAARSTLPDIDVDVESARRHDVYRAIVGRYGDHRVTLLSMQNAYRARSAVRDVGLALGLDAQLIDTVAKGVWRIGARDLRAALGTKPELREVARLVGTDDQLDLLIDLVASLDRLPRHISMHPCGVILGDADLLSLTPVQPSGMGLAMSQFDKDDIDDLGLLKLDVLGVRMQSSMAYALTEIARVNGPDTARAGGLPPDVPYVAEGGRIELDAVPHDDEPTFAAIRTTDTLGIFQLESPGQRELIGKLQPDRYSDLIADISLFRPGPMQANMIIPFVEAKHGYRRPDYVHPRFKEFLTDSYGVVIYHEHVLRILADCMGIDLTHADELRRKLSSQADLVEKLFRSATRENRDQAGLRLFTDRDVDRIWSALRSFGGFGFCKAHAASFALPTYQSAWLKTHYPAEFLAGILEHDPGMYPRRLLLGEARRTGIPVLPLDVNVSSGHYQVELLDDGRKGIRLSLSDVRGITKAEIRRITDGRPYLGVEDLYQRAEPSRPLMRRLAAVGALDTLTRPAVNRGDVIAHVRRLTARRSRPGRPWPGQLTLPLDARVQVATGNPDLTVSERIRTELDVLSAEFTEHAVETYRPMLDDLEVTSAGDLLSLRNGSRVLVAGIRVATQTPPTRSGRRVVFITVDDGTGCAECMFFEPAQACSGSVLFGTSVLLVAGRTRRTGERGIAIHAEAAWDLKQQWATWQTTHSAPSSISGVEEAV
jgi:error-prone DNA polymerase